MKNYTLEQNDMLKSEQKQVQEEPQCVDKPAYLALESRVFNIRKAIAALQDEYERLNRKVEVAENAVLNATKMVTIAKGMVTKAKKTYCAIIGAGDEKELAYRYGRMVERERHLISVQMLQTKAKREFEFRMSNLMAFARTWDEQEDILNKALEKAQKKVRDAKRAYQLKKRQEELEEVFGQRYERAEWVPEKEATSRYKVLNVKPQYLYEGMELIEKLRKLGEELAEVKYEISAMGDDVTEDLINSKKELISKGRDVFNEFAKNALESAKLGAFEVSEKQCRSNSVSASAMSDIMGVAYGLRTPTRKLISVDYDLMETFQVSWEFLAEKYEQANARMHNLRVFMAKRLVKHGVNVRFEQKDKPDLVLHYDLLTSNNTQQKKGQCYMGEAAEMKRTQKAREFGFMMEDAIANRPDNAAEWLKRGATLTTPSVILKDKNGMTVSIAKVLMVNDVEIKRQFDNVTVIDVVRDDKGKEISFVLKNKQKKEMVLTMFDGQALWLKKGMPTTQGRGPGLKYMAGALPDYELPEYAIDIMGNKVRVADYDILMSKSCWKAAKMGLNWYQFRDKVVELAEEFPGYDLLRAVRYSDREIGDEENPRNLARQATQQWVKIPEMGKAIEKLTRKTRRWLQKQKKWSNILGMMCEFDRPEAERSSLAKLFAMYPNLIAHPYIKQWVETRWIKNRNRACSGRLRTEGMYPYILQDPIAMIQIMLEGRNPMDTDLGVLAANEVNLPKVKNGRKVYCIRYPANYLVGMIRFQKNVDAFRNLGNVAILPYYGDTIVRADGDFDGDEMLFLFDELIIELMEKMIEEFTPGLIDFPHGKVACNAPFGSRDGFVDEVSAALVRAQEFNLVGTYSNLAVLCLQEASVSSDTLSVKKWLNGAILAHVGAIVCLDMVKGADVPQMLLDKLEKLNQETRRKHKMPWNQMFSHPEAEVEKRTNSTQDTIAGMIYDENRDFEIDFEGKAPVEFEDNILVDLLHTGVTSRAIQNMVVSEETVQLLRGCHFEDELDQKSWAKLNGGEKLSAKDWMRLGWHNASAILWKLPGLDRSEKREEVNYFIREALMAHVRTEWVGKNGVIPIEERYAAVVKSLVCDAFDCWVGDDGSTKQTNNGQASDKKGSYLMFVLRIFAKDLVAIAENGGVTKELAIAMSAPRPEPEMKDVPRCLDFGEEVIVNDGSIWLGNDDTEIISVA